MDTNQELLVCNLSTAGAAKQLLDWDQVRSWSTGRSAIANGYELRFPVEKKAQIFDLVDRESACCTFLDIETRIVDDEIVVGISSDRSEAKDILKLLSGGG